MSVKSLEQRVKDSFAKGESAEYVDTYHEALLKNIHRTDDRFHHAVLLLVFSVVVFELLTHTAITEATLGPFKLNNLPLLQKYVPLLTAYSYCAVISLGTMRKYMRDLSVDILVLRHRSIHDSGLDYFLEPTSVLHMAETVESFSSGVRSKMSRGIMGVIVISLLFAPLVFIVFAFYRCFSIFGFRDVNVWISCFLSLVLVVQSLLVLVHYRRDL